MAIILGLESSCDDSAAALVTSERQILAQAIVAQNEAHRPFGGVVPEIAARAHVEILPGLIRQVLAEAVGIEQVHRIRAKRLAHLVQRGAGVLRKEQSDVPRDQRRGERGAVAASVRVGAGVDARQAERVVQQRLVGADDVFRQLSLLRVDQAMIPVPNGQELPRETIFCDDSLRDALSKMLRTGQRQLVVMDEA